MLRTDGVGAADMGGAPADIDDDAADIGDGAADMGDGAADMGDGAAGSIPVFVDAVVGIDIRFGTDGGLYRGDPSSDGLAGAGADVGVGIVVNSCIPVDAFCSVARLPECNKGSWMPPPPDV